LNWADELRFTFFVHKLRLIARQQYVVNASFPHVVTSFYAFSLVYLSAASTLRAREATVSLRALGKSDLGKGSE